MIWCGVTALILAGGKSSRFGSDKSLLILNQKLIVQHLVECCSSFADEVLIVSNQDAKFGLPGIRELHDIYPDMGPLGGIHAGLCAAKNDYIFVSACDMPFFDEFLAKCMLSQLDEYQAVLPYYQNKYEPLFSALRRDKALSVTEYLLQHNKKRMMLLFEQLETYCWECTKEEHENFYNINYREDYFKLLMNRNTYNNYKVKNEGEYYETRKNAYNKNYCISDFQ